MGVGMRITKEYGDQLTEGILQVMKELGMWKGAAGPVRRPMISRAVDEVEFVNAPKAGIFVQTASHGQYLHRGEEIGQIIDPLEGKVRARIRSEAGGVLFTIREYPVVDEGSLIARILKREEPYVPAL